MGETVDTWDEGKVRTEGADRDGEQIGVEREGDGPQAEGHRRGERSWFSRKLIMNHQVLTSACRYVFLEQKVLLLQ